MARSAAPDVVQTTTAAIIAQLEQGQRPWVRPWRVGGMGRPLRSCGEPYRGFNTLNLWMAGDAAGYGSRYWLTYKQAETLGAQVRKGERARRAIFYTAYTKTVSDELGERDEQRRVLKSYAVFNADQIDGLPDRFRPPVLETVPVVDRLPDAAARFFAALPGKVEHRGDHAYYEISTDRIVMPPVDRFERGTLYGATLAHEYCHWTGATARLGRTLANRFGSDAYAAEELIAELGSALIGAELGLPADHLESHANYIGSWLRVLKRDPRSILTIAGQAERAAGYLLDAAGMGSRSDDDAAANDELAEAA